MALTDKIDNYPGFDDGINGFDLGMKMLSGAEKFGARTEYADVQGVELDGTIKKIKTETGEFLAKTVIVATGANPRQLGLDGEEALVGRGVHYCAHCDGRFYKGKTVIVVGGGNSAAADALYLSHLAERVYVVHRRDALRATKIYHDPLLKAKNVEMVWDSAIDGFISDGRVEGARVKNLKSGAMREIYADGIFVSIGRQPAIELFEGQLLLDQSGYIVADETTKTNVDGVFAIGDVRTKVLRQVVTAVADGATAVHFAEEYLSLSGEKYEM